MVRWFKLFGYQYFGFWALGLVCFAVQEIPYMLMPLLHLQTNPIMNMVETSAGLNKKMEAINAVVNGRG